MTKAIRQFKIDSKPPLSARNILFLFVGDISVNTSKGNCAVQSKSYFYYDDSLIITSASPYVHGYYLSVPAHLDFIMPSEKTRLFQPNKIPDYQSLKIFLESFSKESKLNTELTRSYLNLISTKLRLKESCESNEPSIFNDFVVLINENINNNLCAGSYAEMLGISLKTLIKTVKDETGKTPCNIITEKVIERAKHLLRTSSDSSKMIAYKLGFHEPYYFIKYFKKGVGLTPTQYKKQLE